MKKFNLLASMMLMISSVSYGDVVTKSFESKGIQSLNVVTATGNIVVKTSADQKINVSANKIKFDKECTLVMEQVGSEIKVEIQDQKYSGFLSFNSPRCEVDVNVTVPEKLALNLITGFGSLDVKGIIGPIQYLTGSGKIDLEGDLALVEGKSGSGDTEIKGLIGDADIATGSGSVTITLSKVPEKGHISVKTGSGETVVYAPAQSKINANLKTGSGQMVNELGSAPDAAYTVSVKTGSGDLTLKKNL